MYKPIMVGDLPVTLIRDFHTKDNKEEIYRNDPKFAKEIITTHKLKMVYNSNFKTLLCIVSPFLAFSH